MLSPLATALLISMGNAQLSDNDYGFVHRVAIEGNSFVDSITGTPFSLKGVDYQPGGSAAYDRSSDPLSDRDTCARDIFLMQQLGINTVRIYTINPALDHDDCMTMLAAAGIYLILDVNSPLVGESLNRYEPWTTYTPDYLRHVFEVVDQFSRYNNTLGFFIGNEIVNDERSAAVSPPYIRAVARDVKDYMYYNCPRMVPIGYSAADNLKYRTQLPHYLTCGDPESAVDFYGVNSYQWCGNQTMETSGYDILIKDHEKFDFPVFLSEFGCNHIQPRIFQEVEVLFSPQMSKAFAGGLVYEFTQEPNDYGLVDIDSNGDAWIRGEFETLQKQFTQANEIMGSRSNLSATVTSIISNGSVASFSYSSSSSSMRKLSGIRSSSTGPSTRNCRPSYSYLSGASKSIPASFGTEMISNGVRVKRGRYNPSLLENMPAVHHTIYDVYGRPLDNPAITIKNNFTEGALEIGWDPRTGVRWKSEEESNAGVRAAKEVVKKRKNSADAITPALFSVFVVLLLWI